MKNFFTITNEEKKINLFLDYKNNFLTIEKFAEYYGFELEKANSIINQGRELNEKRATENQNFVIN